MCPWLMHTRSMNKKSTLALEMVTSNSFGKELVLDFFGDSVRHDEERKEKRERERERERKKGVRFRNNLPLLYVCASAGTSYDPCHV